MYYFIYAFGLPLILTGITYYIDTYSTIPEKFKPNMGTTTCFFASKNFYFSIECEFLNKIFLFIEMNDPGHTIFFIIPIGIQIGINVILFVITAIHCNKVKSEIHRMQNTSDGNEYKKKRFIADKAQ